MAYSEIINEIQEQIDELQARHDAKLIELEEIQAEIPRIVQQIANLQQLKVNAQDISNSFDINLNVKVNSTDLGGGRVIDHSLTA